MLRHSFFAILIFLLPAMTLAQRMSLGGQAPWVFYPVKQFHPLEKPMKARVPGSVYTDLLTYKRIPDPFWADQHLKLAWVDKSDWCYETTFELRPNGLKQAAAELVFEGIDTYGEIYLNGQLLGRTNNMFRTWRYPVRQHLRTGRNTLRVFLRSATRLTDSIAKAQLPLMYPDHPRVHARKAQYQFGWDWGPALVGCGIWKNVWLDVYDTLSPVEAAQNARDQIYASWKPRVSLIQQPDSIGRSFQFTVDGIPTYMKGANWIPGTCFPGSMTKAEYRTLLLRAKEANMNMIRVWGGGYYENDDFYDLCDSLGIHVWQDLMFACAMYPADPAATDNLRNEIRDQVRRLRHHPCIVVWCGNNESEEGWKNWGWQKQFGLHGADSARVWSDYTRLFHDSLPAWIRQYDNRRPYLSTSPANGWGHARSFTEGDSHYWGLWWGLEDWEVFRTKTGRFVSEYGMQSLSDIDILHRYVPDSARFPGSDAIRAHQRAANGFMKLHHYLNRYFFDTTQLGRLTLREYSYLTQCMQAYVLEQVIHTHLSQQPRNQGSLLWQLNDCWPATSWSILNVGGSPKASWYAVRRAWATPPPALPDTTRPKELTLLPPHIRITPLGQNRYRLMSDQDARFVWLYQSDGTAEFSDNYIWLKKDKPMDVTLLSGDSKKEIKVMSLYDILQKR